MQGTLSIWWRGVFTGGEGWWNHWSIFTLPRFTLSGHFAVKLYWYSQTFTTAASTSDFICLLTDTPELYTTEERVIYNPASLYLDSLSIQCQFRTYQEQGKAAVLMSRVVVVTKVLTLYHWDVATLLRAALCSPRPSPRDWSAQLQSATRAPPRRREFLAR